MWYPANLYEREMAYALVGRNLSRFLRAVTRAQLFVPQHPAGSHEGHSWQLVTEPVMGWTVVPAFTSDDGLLEMLGDEVAGLLVTDYQQLRDNWPDPDWRLAINPGLPIEAYLPVELVAAGARGEPLHAGDAVARRLGEPGHGWTPWPPGGPLEALLDAVSQGDAAEFLDALRSCPMIVPTTRTVTDLELRELLTTRWRAAPTALASSPGFPWSPVGPSEDPTIEIFTDIDYMVERYRDRPYATVLFQEVIRILPPGHALSVDPAGPTGLDLASDQVPLLAQWNSTEPVPQPLELGMRWLREQAQRDLGMPAGPPIEPPLRARTYVEAHLYMDVRPCDNCGTRGFSGRSAEVVVDGERCYRYTGACRTCGVPRTFTFQARALDLAPRGTEAAAGSAPVFGGPEESELLDPGEWLALADLVASGGSKPAPSASDLAVAAAFIDEVLKFVPDGAAVVPAAVLRTDRGRAVYQQGSERFHRSQLESVAASYRQRAGSMRSSDR